jgi:hypothetical protein
MCSFVSVEFSDVELDVDAPPTPAARTSTAGLENSSNNSTRSSGMHRREVVNGGDKLSFKDAGTSDVHVARFWRLDRMLSSLASNVGRGCNHQHRSSA